VIPGIPRISITADGPNTITISAEEFVAAQEALESVHCHPPIVARDGADAGINRDDPDPDDPPR
jgi:hypothetical protein